MAELLASGERPRALICLNDRIAFGAYQALTAAGLTVPDDVSVVSFDDSPLAAWLRPPLTSVSIPYLEMGRLAVETLLSPSRARGPILVPHAAARAGLHRPPGIRRTPPVRPGPQAAPGMPVGVYRDRRAGSENRDAGASPGGRAIEEGKET